MSYCSETRNPQIHCCRANQYIPMPVRRPRTGGGATNRTARAQYSARSKAGGSGGNSKRRFMADIIPPEQRVAPGSRSGLARARSSLGKLPSQSLL